jgi:hypothetical protein
MLVTYDWSGKIVLKETPLTINITTDKDQVMAEWKEEGTDTITVKGLWKEQALTFTDAKQGRRGHYNAGSKVLWNFTDAQLQLLQDDSASYLVGNLQMFSPQTMEPNQPMYINLRKTSQAVSTVVPSAQRGFYVYPNPFNEGLNISFQQDKAGPVSVVMLTTSGEKVYSTALGKYPQGQSDITLTLDLKPGAYILRLLTAGKQQQTVVIKK